MAPIPVAAQKDGQQLDNEGSWVVSWRWILVNLLTYPIVFWKLFWMRYFAPHYYFKKCHQPDCYSVLGVPTNLLARTKNILYKHKNQPGAKKPFGNDACTYSEYCILNELLNVLVHGSSVIRRTMPLRTNHDPMTENIVFIYTVVVV